MQQRIDDYEKQFDEMAAQPVLQEIHIDSVVVKQRPLVEVEPIEGAGYKGYLLIVSDPKKLRVVVPNRMGKGESVSSMVKRTGAIAGVNGGAFVDPKWQGNGFQPAGVVISRGKMIYNGNEEEDKNKSTHIIGIDKDGTMIAGKYKPSEMLEMGIQEAVTFAPRFIVDGQGLIKSPEDGWGLAPRTCMAQKEDGTILFAIVDGRQADSVGATLYDIQQILLDHGAVIAANLDGGASTVLVHENRIVNTPSSPYGERLLPTAWLVFDNPDQLQVTNIWEGLDMDTIDPAKW